MLCLLFAGEGGQGVQSAAQILAQALFEQGLKVIYIPNFGVEQRGGVSLAFLVVDRQEVSYPKFDLADILAIFSDRSLERVKQYAAAKTKLVLTPAVSKKIKIGGQKFWVGDQFNHRFWNVVVLGKVACLTGLVSKDDLKRAMEKRFTRLFVQNPKLKKLDFEAFESAWQ